ncbi:unnamed protein product [Clavelina lepadiformis]|uniref:VWFA domain-containing protein n=1 Tax=Clavelina lepadiformis TaxID=159417 RepID=A0ABP0F2E9_CLALP
MLHCGRAIFLWALLSHMCESFNIEDSVESFNFIHPAGLASQAGENLSTSDEGRSPSFFGYNVKLDTSGSFMVGAPYFTDTTNTSDEKNSSSRIPTGNLFSCHLMGNTNCSSIRPPDLQPGNAFGQSLELSAEGDLVACSPTQKQMCTSVNYNPGYCYKTSDLGQAWNPDPRTINTSCPIFALDLMFLLDGSGSVGADNFERVKNWTKAVANNFNINDDSTRVGVVQYAHFYDSLPLNEQPYIVTEIALGEYNSTAAFGEAVDKIDLFSFTTYTAHALNKTVADFKSSNRFDSDSTAKVLILLTDGRSSDAEYLEQSAAYVRSLGITTFSVGVGRAVKKELRVVATGTDTDERVYYVSEFSGLNEIVNRLRNAILNFALEGSSSGDVSAIAYDLQLAQIGFSSHYSNKKSV